MKLPYHFFQQYMFSKAGFGSNPNVDQGFEVPDCTTMFCFFCLLISWYFICKSLVCTIMPEGKHKTQRTFFNIGYTYNSNANHHVFNCAKDRETGEVGVHLINLLSKSRQHLSRAADNISPM